ncbi:NUDIX domain-containing protein [Gemmatimonas sp.]|uniref:NUDIX domain-containing protein n=1 Tax=Gemmatimonas sp. TaxID=1962908 RepID=UPI0033403194
MTDKVVPVLLRGAGAATELLVFRHPLAGVQLIKGTIEPSESAEAAALRELYEEAGVADAAVVGHLGTWLNPHTNDVWHLQLIRVSRALQNAWAHETGDGGGLTFLCFWHRLDEDGDGDWHVMYRDALGVIRDRMRDGVSADEGFRTVSLAEASRLPRRQSARLLVLDDNARLLLFRYDDGRRPPFWATAGGQVLPGERPEDTAARELFEETGLRGQIGRLVRERVEVFAAGDLPLTEWHESYFEVQTRGGVLQRQGWTAEEHRTIRASRWWSLAELQSTTETVLPTWLPEALAQLVGGSRASHSASSRQ